MSKIRKLTQELAAYVKVWATKFVCLLINLTLKYGETSNNCVILVITELNSEFPTISWIDEHVKNECNSSFGSALHSGHRWEQSTRRCNNQTRVAVQPLQIRHNTCFVFGGVRIRQTADQFTSVSNWAPGLNFLIINL
jgi:hypothetical protein